MTSKSKHWSWKCFLIGHNLAPCERCGKELEHSWEMRINTLIYAVGIAAIGLGLIALGLVLLR